MIALRVMVSAGLMLAAALGTGCAGAARPPRPPPDDRAPEAGAPRSPQGAPDLANQTRPRDAALATDGSLRPAGIRIHPLTRFARSDDGRTELVCHVELKDQFQQSVKGLGLLRFELYRPGDGAASEVQECIWSVDLRNPEVNAAAYDDLVTRTYTARLGSLPEPIQRWLSEAESGGQTAGWLTLRAYFTPAATGSRPQVLTAAQRLQR